MRKPNKTNLETQAMQTYTDTMPTFSVTSCFYF